MRLRLMTGFAALTLAACGALPPGGGTVVRGRGDPVLDVAAVQEAVDRGGLVRLQGEFDFGATGSVRITRDVAILGEATATQGPRTVIRGGQAPLRSLPPEQAGAGPRVEILHIHFDGPRWMAVHLAHASSVAVVGNRFTRVQPIAFPASPMSQGKPYNMQQAVVIGGTAIAPGQPLPYRPDAVTGPLAVSGNEFDLATPAAKSTIGMAVWVVRATGVRGEIAGNTIRNAPRNAIEVIDNFRAADGSGELAIRGNDLTTPAEGAPMPTPRTPNGIVVGYFLDPGAALDEARVLPLRVRDNTIRLRGQGTASFGVSVLMNRAEVRGNRIVLEAPGAIGISIGGSSNRVEGNRFEGSGRGGIVLASIAPLTASRNELVANDFTLLKASGANVVLMKGADANRVVGSSGSVQDQGEGNVTSGLSPVAQANR